MKLTGKRSDRKHNLQTWTFGFRNEVGFDFATMLSQISTYTGILDWRLWSVLYRPVGRAFLSVSWIVLDMFGTESSFTAVTETSLITRMDRASLDSEDYKANFHFHNDDPNGWETVFFIVSG